MGTAQGITLSESAHAFCFVISEDSDGAGYLSRDEVVVAVSQSFGPGQVLSRAAIPANVTEFAAAGSNTGNGTVTLASPGVDANAERGEYKLIFTDATHFIVQSATDRLVGEGVVGTAFTKSVLFTIAAGGTAFVAGDSFKINVDVEPELDEQYVAWTGASPAKAIAAFPVSTNSTNTKKTTVINAHATVRLADLTFAVGATQAQIDQAKADLTGKLIKFR